MQDPLEMSLTTERAAEITDRMVSLGEETHPS